MDGIVRSTGVVVAVDEKGMHVRAPVNASSDECSTMCESCGLCKEKKTRYQDVHVTPPKGGVAYSPGDRVVVEYSPRDPALAAVVFFAPPLLGLLVGGLFARYLFGAGDGGFLAGCLSGFVVGFLPPLALRRWIGTVLRPEARLVDKRFA